MQTAPYPVKIINWGYWGGVGVVATDAYNRQLSTLGVLSIEAEEGMKAVEQILSHRVDQCVPIKANEEVLRKLGVEAACSIELLPKNASSFFDAAVRALEGSNQPPSAPPPKDQVFQELHPWAHELVLYAFQKMGVFLHDHERHDKQTLKAQLMIIPTYDTYYECLLDMLAKAEWIDLKGETIATTPAVERFEPQTGAATLHKKRDRLIQTYPESEAYTQLLWRCLINLPGVLRGEQEAVEVFFPDTSMELAARVYRGNPHSDYFNHWVVLSLQAYLQVKLPQVKKDEKIRILEVGAGTGGTTAFVLEALQPFGKIVEYSYTDLSYGFIEYGKNLYGTLYPFMDFKFLDIEKDIVAQGYKPGSFDVVIATNVLHATTWITETVQHVKGLLKTHGILILNEATEAQDIGTLTFGLLEGWWLFKDQEKRLRHSPLLSRTMWEALLKKEGFDRVTSAVPIHSGDTASTQHVILAESNGEWKQKIETSEKPEALLAQPTDRDLAVIGMAGRFPGADSPDAFWENLVKGKDSITEIPEERWDANRYYEPLDRPSAIDSRWGGFLAHADKFDPQFFHVSPREAELMDPQERLFLQTAWEALEDAGYTRETIRGKCVGGKDLGVFAGVMWGDYQFFGADLESSKGQPGSWFSSISNRVSFFLNAKGPSLSMDTACSSSLVALHVARESLLKGECRTAIVGGVNLSLHPNKYIKLSQLKMLSVDGRCKSFGEGANGIVPGEGVGAILLKSLKDAIEDGDQLYGVIKGSAVNHGGRTSGYTVPNPAAQTDLIVEALADAAVDAASISYIEAHGTGTLLGDPIEIQGLEEALGEEAKDREVCSIGSVKSNIGHLEGAAGISGIIKVLLQLKHGKLAPSLHSSVLNPHISFKNNCFKVQQECEEWKRPVVKEKEVPRRAGISSFGAGGTNAHVIIEEPPAPGLQRPPGPQADKSPVLIVLSAKDEDRLKAYAEKLRVYITQYPTPDTHHLSNLAYTLQVGREAMEERLAMIVESSEELEEKLREFLERKEDVKNLYRSQVKRNIDTLAAFAADEDMANTIDVWISKGKYHKLLDLWVKGMVFDWNKLYTDVPRPRRISAPAYPFAKERYWICESKSLIKPARADLLLHPLVHKNTSTLEEQRFSSTFTGEEFFFVDHLVSGQKVLPGIAYLEMVREAITQATGGTAEINRSIQLRHVAWARPIMVGEQPIEVTIGLFPEENKEIAYEIYTDTQNLKEEPPDRVPEQER